MHVVAMRPTDVPWPNGRRHAGPLALIRRLGRGLLLFRPRPVAPPLSLQLDAIETGDVCASLCRSFGIIALFLRKMCHSF